MRFQRLLGVQHLNPNLVTKKLEITEITNHLFFSVPGLRARPAKVARLFGGELGNVTEGL